MEEDAMATSRVMTVAFLGALVICLGRGAAGAEDSGVAADAQRHVVSDVEIQARLDAQTNQESADHQAITHLLRRPEVRRIAASAGLDLRRAYTAAAVISGQQLKDVVAQARAAA